MFSGGEHYSHRAAALGLRLIRGYVGHRSMVGMAMCCTFFAVVVGNTGAAINIIEHSAFIA